uniref:Peptidase M23 domain-containing protein n=1 Tax=Aureoumbra lagunensis TaxID=44058 RepID=A0A7S3K4G7_9STRA|mmetsp:Transcript_20596/g.26679  ORF Transcript_20596/g.26679 Transcript_20596/m.26679 type:complete len:444 (+) Transcript_20596:35-1366(+)
MSEEVRKLSLGEILAGQEMLEFALPYPAKSRIYRLASGHGRCIQGVNGISTHRGTLAYSFDFKLRVGTPVLAARGGVVAAVVTHFSGGGARAHLAPRANYIAIRHDDGSYGRYYHLRKDGSKLKVGDRVKRGQVIALSGNTGYTGGPHLHFDVVNVLPEETAILHYSLSSNDTNITKISAIAAAFCCELPHVPKIARLRLFPNDVPWKCVLSEKEKLAEPFFALADRDTSQSFAQRIAALAELGAAGVIVANSRNGPELFAMGGCEEPSAVPGVLISKESGNQLKKILLTGQPIYLQLSAHPAVKNMQPFAEQLKSSSYKDKPTFSFLYGPKLRYVTRTLPVAFSSKKNASSKSYVPVQPRLYPPVIQPPSCSCSRSNDQVLSQNSSNKNTTSLPTKRRHSFDAPVADVHEDLVGGGVPQHFPQDDDPNSETEDRSNSHSSSE